MITVVGAGALGSHLILFLRSLEQPLKIIDFDRVETKNTMSQFYAFQSARQNKAVALSRAMVGMFGRRVEANPHKLTSDNRDVQLHSAELIVDCTDNFEARIIIQHYARTHGVPCLHGALSADGSFSRVLWDEDFVADHEGEEGEATCEDGEHLPFYAAVAAYMAIEVQRFLKTGKKSSIQITPAGLVRLR